MSLFYILVEFSCGQLPWRRITDKEAVGRVKADFDHSDLLRHLPGPQFKDFLGELQMSDYFTEPNYSLLRHKLLECMEYNGVNDNDPFDWETSVTDAVNNCQLKAEKAAAQAPRYFSHIITVHMLLPNF